MRTGSLPLCCRTLIAFIILLLPSVSQAQYTIAIVPALPGGDYSFPQAVNNQGQVVGYTSLNGGALIRSFLYSNGNVIDLGTTGGLPSGQATGINDKGQITGYSAPGNGSGSSTNYRAFLYDQSIHDISNGVGTWPMEINSKGDIVGFSSFSGSAQNGNNTVTYSGAGFLYSGGVLKDINTLIPNTGFLMSSAGGINDLGQIAGAGVHFDNQGISPTHVLFYSNGSITDLGALPGPRGLAEIRGLNDAGQITVFGTGRGFVYTGGQFQNIGNLGGPFTQPDDINNAGQIVGTGLTASFAGAAFLYDQGAIQNLNTFLPPNSGWTLIEATGINDKGQIVGLGVFNNVVQGFLLSPPTPVSPVPEPGILALLASLGVSSLLAVRRVRRCVR